MHACKASKGPGKIVLDRPVDTGTCLHWKAVESRAHPPGTFGAGWAHWGSSSWRPLLMRGLEMPPLPRRIGLLRKWAMKAQLAAGRNGVAGAGSRAAYTYTVPHMPTYRQDIASCKTKCAVDGPKTGGRCTPLDKIPFRVIRGMYGDWRVDRVRRKLTLSSDKKVMYIRDNIRIGVLGSRKYGATLVPRKHKCEYTEEYTDRYKDSCQITCCLAKLTKVSCLCS